MTSGLYKRYKNDENVEKTGVRLELGPNSKGLMMAMQVARAGGTNTSHTKAAERHLKPYRRQLQSETMERKLLERKMMEIFVDGCLLGWENIEDENEQPLTFTRDNAIKLFTDLPDLYDEVVKHAGDATLFRQVVEEADAKN